MAYYHDDVASLSSLEDTDEFGRKLLQHTKDAQRISNLQSSAFRKAKPLPHAVLNLDNLERNNLYNPPAYAAGHHHPASLTGSSASDPPLNLPRDWGRKGRPNHAWMRQIYGQNQNPADSSLNIDWADAANDAVDATDRVSPSQRRSRIESSPHGSHADQWESDQDFSAASLLASTPALPSRNRLTINQIREREIQTIESRPASSTRRQAWQQTTSETLSRGPRDSFAESAAFSRAASAPAIKTAVSNKENIPLEPRHSPRNLYASVESSQPASHITPRPVQRRTDSMALLKRLSRTPSASPSPTSANNTAPPNSSQLQETSWSEKYPKTSNRSLFQRDSPQAPEVVKAPESIYLSPGNSSQAPEVVEGPVLQQQPQKRPEPAFTPLRPVERDFPLKTPVVTGAWIDTPQTARPPPNSVPVRDTNTSAHPSDIPMDQPSTRKISEPDLPKSALDAVLKDLREGKRKEDDDPTLGDSTIASLEEVMNPSADTTMRLDLPSVPSTQPQSSQSRDEHKSQTQRDKARNDEVDTAPTTQKERNKRQKWFALEALKKRLGGTSAQDEPVQKSTTDEPLREAITSALTTESASARPHMHMHTTGAHCTQCGRPTSVLRAAWNEYWGLYFRRERKSPLGFRLTWLGLLCTLFWSWLITELLLSSIFSPPMYATRMRGYGVDPHAPRFPYVLPTLIWRPLSPALSPLVSVAVWSSKAMLGKQQYKYYPPSPGAWGSAGRVKIGPPGPNSAYSMNRADSAADHVVWFDEETTGQAWHSGETAHKADVWSQGQAAWENEGDSMLADEVI